MLFFLTGFDLGFTNIMYLLGLESPFWEQFTEKFQVACPQKKGTAILKGRVKAMPDVY